MSTTTEKYGFLKPDPNDFYDVKEDISDNMDKVEEALSEFDDSGSVEEIKNFPDFLSKFLSGNKLAITLRNLKAGLQFVLHAGQIVNNCVTDNAGLPLSAAQGKALMDKYTQLYSEVSNPDRINLNVLIEKTSLNSPERTGVYYVTGNNIGALPSGFSNYGILLCMRSPYSLHPTNSNCVYVQEYTDVYGKHASRSFNNGAWTNWTTTATKDDLNNVYCLSGKKSIPQKADMNTYKTPGNYYCPSNTTAQTLANSPMSGGFSLKVEDLFGDGKYIIQSYTSYKMTAIIYRAWDGYDSVWRGPMEVAFK